MHSRQFMPNVNYYYLLAKQASLAAFFAPAPCRHSILFFGAFGGDFLHRPLEARHTKSWRETRIIMKIDIISNCFTTTSLTSSYINIFRQRMTCEGILGKDEKYQKHKLINMLKKMRKNCNLIWIWNQAWSGWMLTGWSLFFHLALFGSVGPLAHLIASNASQSRWIFVRDSSTVHQSNCISLAAYVTSRDIFSQYRRAVFCPPPSHTFSPRIYADTDSARSCVLHFIIANIFLIVILCPHKCFRNIRTLWWKNVDLRTFANKLPLFGYVSKLFRQVAARHAHWNSFCPSFIDEHRW